MKILTIGDVMLDIYYNSIAKRYAAEANIPIYDIINTEYKLGGASNIAFNLNNLDVDIEIVSVIGNDIHGNIIKNMFDNFNIKYKLFIDKNRKTTQKNRIICENIIKCRYDIEDINDIDSDLENNIFDYIKNCSNINAIIISDYDKGVLTENLCKNIINYSNNKNIYTFIDPKLKNINKYNNCFLFKPNLSESKILSGENKLDKIFFNIKNKINPTHILITCGENGMYINNKENQIKHDNKINVIDVTGAGDIVISSITYWFLKSKNIHEAVKISNYISGKSVKVLGNYKMSLSDFDEYFLLTKKIFFTNILEDMNSLEKIIKLKKNDDNKIIFTNGCFDIFHSAHLRLLNYCKSLGNTLIVGLNSDNSIKRLKGNNRPINKQTERLELLNNLKIIDLIIVFDEDTPLNILEIIKPDVLVKGGDYNIENIIGKEFSKSIDIFNSIENISTTNIVNTILRQTISDNIIDK